MEVDTPVPESRLPPKMRKAWIAKNAARLRDRNSHREPGPDMDVDTPMADHGTGQHGVKEESYFGTLVCSIPVARISSLVLSVDSRDMPPPPIPPSHTPPPLLTPNNGSREGSTGQPLPPESLTSPSLPFSKLSLLSPVIPAPSAVSSSCPESLSSPNPNNSHNIPSTSKGNVTVSSTSASASKSSSTPGSKTSKPTARKPRRPTLAASTSRVDAKATKAAKVTKARGKGKEKATEKDKKATGKDRESDVASNKSTRPGTPATGSERDEPVLKPSLHRGDSIQRVKSSDSAHSPGVAYLSLSSPVIREAPLSDAASTPPPPATPIALVPDLPPDPPGEPQHPIPEPIFVSDQSMDVDSNVKPDVPVLEVSSDAMLVDQPSPITVRDLPPASPLAVQSPLVSLPLPSTPSTLMATLHPSAPESSPAASHRSLSSPGTAPTPLPPSLSLLLSSPTTPADQRLEPERQPSAASEAPSPMDVPVALPSSSPAPAADSQLEAEQPSGDPSTHSPESPNLPHSEPVPAAQPAEPPAPPKVKLSLKDFAMRKKKQREEQLEREKEEMVRTAVTSPEVTADAPLHEVDHHELPSGDPPEKAAADGEAEPASASDANAGEHDEDMRMGDTQALVDVKMGGDDDRETAQQLAEVPEVQPSASDASSAPPLPPPISEVPFDPPPPLNDQHLSSSVEDTYSVPPLESLETKQEALDEALPHDIVAPLGERSPSRSSVRPSSPAPVAPHTSPKASPPLAMSVSQQSHEDGEIFSPPPPKPPPLAPRSHTLSTHSRSSYNPAGMSPPRRSPPPSARRPLHPAAQFARNTSSSRGVPSAPRALRENAYGAPSMSMYGGGGGGQNAPYFAPRGPSADRDRPSRDWGRERDGERAWIPGPSRGRGRGSWGR